MQEVLFQDPIGMRLRQGREKAGLSIEQVGQQLKLPVAIVQAMERDDWQRLGAPVYVRSYLGSYLRLVGLPGDLAEQAAQTKATPTLVTMGSHSRMRHAFKHSMRNAVYLGLTAMLVIPVVLVARHYQTATPSEVMTLETSPQTVPMDPLAAQELPTPAPAIADAVPTVDPAVVDAAEGPDPVMASMAPFPKATVDTGGLLIRFNGESWVDVVDGQGARIERGIVASGDERRYAAGQVARITLGNADGVEVTYAGKVVDLTPYRAANVARFAVSSTGEPATAGN